MGSLTEERLTPMIGAFTNFGIFERRKEIVTINEFTSKLETYSVKQPEILKNSSSMSFPHPSTIFQLDPDYYEAVWVRLVDRIEILDKHLRKILFVINLKRDNVDTEYLAPTPLCSGYAMSQNKKFVLVHFISRPVGCETAVATLKLFSCRAGGPLQLWTKVMKLSPNTAAMVSKYHLKAVCCGLFNNTFYILTAENDELFVTLARDFHLKHRRLLRMKIPVGNPF